MERFKRKNRKDISFKGGGSLFDALDNVIKENWRINDAEYDFICDQEDDSYKYLYIDDKTTFSEAKECLRVINRLIGEYNKLNNV